MDQVFEGVIIYIDDVLNFGSTQEEHDERLTKFLERARETNLKLNEEKSQLGLQEIVYLGHIISKDGLKVDERKVKTIRNMPKPQNRDDLKRFLGMATYVSKFIPNFSSLTAQLRDLENKKVEWEWQDVHDKAFENIKTALSEAPVLKYYDVNAGVKISVDASKDGVGAVLLQNDQPIAYASKASSKCQKNFAQIEKKMYAIVFGVERFHQYVYGKTITVESDRKPLEAIMKKPLSAAPPRIQRFLLRLQTYDVAIQYKPGKEMYIADTLFRAFQTNEEEDDDADKCYIYYLTEADVDAQVSLLAKHVALSEDKLKVLKDATLSDCELTKLQKVIQNGWPDHRHQVSSNVYPFWTFRDELHVADGLVFKGDRIVVPKCLHKSFIQELHESHLGTDKIKSLARDTLFWIRMGKQIEEFIRNCPTCNEHGNSNQKEMMIPHELPNRPWQDVGSKEQYSTDQYTCS